MIYGDTMKNKKVTIYDIAEKTNFSAVTVHRALTNKGRISKKTKETILAAADEMGYTVNMVAQALRRAPINFAAILVCPVDEYVDDIILGMQDSAKALEQFNLSVHIRKIPFVDYQESLQPICEIIQQYAEKDFDGIILSLSSSKEKTHEVAALAEKLSQTKGIAFATVANNLLPNQAVIHVGVNAFMAGSMAAETLAMSCKNQKVALLSATKSAPINQEYVDGFNHYVKNNVFSDVCIYEYHDHEQALLQATKKMLKDHMDIKGVYIPSASSVLVCQYLQEINRSDLTIVTNDILPQIPSLLKANVADATIFQNPFKQGKCVIDFLYNYVTTGSDAGKHYITPQIVLSSNVEPHQSLQTLL